VFSKAPEVRRIQYGFMTRVIHVAIDKRPAKVGITTQNAARKASPSTTLITTNRHRPNRRPIEPQTTQRNTSDSIGPSTSTPDYQSSQIVSKSKSPLLSPPQTLHLFFPVNTVAPLTPSAQPLHRILPVSEDEDSGSLSPSLSLSLSLSRKLRRRDSSAAWVSASDSSSSSSGASAMGSRLLIEGLRERKEVGVEGCEEV